MRIAEPAPTRLFVAANLYDIHIPLELAVACCWITDDLKATILKRDLLRGGAPPPGAARDMMEAGRFSITLRQPDHAAALERLVMAHTNDTFRRFFDEDQGLDAVTDAPANGRPYVQDHKGYMKPQASGQIRPTSRNMLIQVITSKREDGPGMTFERTEADDWAESVDPEILANITIWALARLYVRQHFEGWGYGQRSGPAFG